MNLATLRTLKPQILAIAAAIVVAPTIAIAKATVIPTSPLQCEILSQMNDKRSLCIYNVGDLTSNAKLYENGQLSDAPDGEYNFVNKEISPKRIYKGVVYSFNGELQPEIVKPNAGWLQIFVGGFNSQLIFFCPKDRQSKCSLANGKYLSSHGLEIPIKAGRVDYKSDDEHTYCTYGRYENVPNGAFDGTGHYKDSPDKTEYVACGEGD